MLILPIFSNFPILTLYFFEFIFLILLTEAPTFPSSFFSYCSSFLLYICDSPAYF